MDKLEKDFYEMYEITPCRITMAGFVKSIEDNVSVDNYEQKKTKVLESFIHTPLIELTKPMIQNAWKDLYKVNQEAYKEFVKQQAINN